MVVAVMAVLMVMVVMVAAGEMTMVVVGKLLHPPPLFFDLHIFLPFKGHLGELWRVLHWKPVFTLMVYALGMTGVAGIYNVAAIILQFRIIKLTQLQNGFDQMSKYAVLVAAIYIFKNHMLQYNWRWMQLGSNVLFSTFGLLWLAVIYDVAGLQNGWFSIFIDVDEAFASGLTQVLFSMAVIEVAEPGLEATTYEFLISCNNAAMTLSSTLSTQLQTPFGVQAIARGDPGTDEAYCGCPRDNDPMMRYTWAIFAIEVLGTVAFVWFLPRQKDHCHEIRDTGGSSATRAWICAVTVTLCICYSATVSTMQIFPSTSCLKFAGGTGCDEE
jgi:hypothetical protein